MITLDQNTCSDLTQSRGKEWIITNGIGGYASSTATGMNTRRYHGLLVAATTPPAGRVVLLSKLEDTIIVDGERIDLSTNEYRGGVIHPEGHRHLASFSIDPFPTFTYTTPKFTLNKSVFMVHGENTVVVEYELTGTNGAQDITLEVRPLIAFRDFHATTHENDAIDRSVQETFGSVRMRPYQGLPELFLSHDADRVLTDNFWYRNFDYAEERSRGLYSAEDLFNPVAFSTSMNGRKRLVIIASTEKHNAGEAADLRRAELRRSSDLNYKYGAGFNSSAVMSSLVRAAEQFVVARPPFKTVIAGYHWFGDWGRDTMIALPGLLLSTDQPEAARDILLQFTAAIDGGMLPNRFPDVGETPEYNTVDATLWFFETVWQYLNYRNDAVWREDALQLIETKLYPALKTIVEHHLAGTRYGIHADQDGFLWAGDSTTQLTWMDAKVGDTAITPRFGRPVEIQALWFNALRIVEELGRLFADSAAADKYRAIADKLEANFESVFWNPEAGCLFDVVGAFTHDAAIRPNQVIAISLRHSLVSPAHARKVLEVARRELLTPFGLRTLSPNDPQYRPRYEGGVWERDSAYHQGTVWPWLAGPFFTAQLRFASDGRQAVAEAKTWLEAFAVHLSDAGLGQVSEIFDGDPPHTPRGCIAQAWSVSELLRLAKTVSKRRHIFAPVKAISMAQPRPALVG